MGESSAALAEQVWPVLVNRQQVGSLLQLAFLGKQLLLYCGTEKAFLKCKLAELHIFSHNLGSILIALSSYAVHFNGHTVESFHCGQTSGH